MESTQSTQDSRVPDSGTTINPNLDSTHASPPAKLSPWSYCTLLLTIMLACILISLDLSIIGTAVPAITSEFHATSDVGWYAAAYPLTMCAYQPLAGKLATIFGLRTTHLSFFAVFLGGSLVCGLSNSSKLFISGRAIAGIGGAGVVSTGMTRAIVATALEKRAFVISMGTAIYTMGIVISPIVGGVFTQHWTWRWCFLINLPVGAVKLIMELLLVKTLKSDATTGETFRQKISQIDAIGCGLFVSAVVMMLFALEWGGSEYPWDSPTVIGLIIGSIGVFTMFVMWELRMEDRAMIPRSLFQGRTMALCVMFAFFFFGGFAIPGYYLAEWFQVVRDETPVHAGIMMLPSMVSPVISTALVAVLAKRVRYWNPGFIFGASCTCIALGFYTTFTATTSTASWIGWQVLQGWGCGIAVPLMLSIVPFLLNNRPHQIPQGLAVIYFAQYFGSAVVQCIAGAIFENRLVDGLHSHAGLDTRQVSMLLDAGNYLVRETVGDNFPDRLGVVLEAYNDAVTKVFFIPTAESGLAVLIALGFEWIDTKVDVVSAQSDGEGR